MRLVYRCTRCEFKAYSIQKWTEHRRETGHALKSVEDE